MMPFAEIGQLLGSTFMVKVSQYGCFILSNYVLDDATDILKCRMKSTFLGSDFEKRNFFSLN